MRFHRNFPHQKLSRLEIVRCEIIGSPLRESEILEKEIALAEEKLKRLLGGGSVQTAHLIGSRLYY